MNLLRKLFSTDTKFVGDFINSGDGLLELVRSNQVARAEFEQFEERTMGVEDTSQLENEATRSADALSGYGISVLPQAFIEAVKK
jgi:hypothetical protein